MKAVVFYESAEHVAASPGGSAQETLTVSFGGNSVLAPRSETVKAA